MASGAAWGAAAWLVYGIVEIILSISIQLWRFSEMEVLGWQWRWIAALLGVYAACGIVLGAAAGLLLGARRVHLDEGPQILAVGSVSLTFGANLIRAWPLARSEQIVLVVDLALLTAFLAAFFSVDWRKRVRFLTSPWIVSLLLLGVPCLSRELLTPQQSSVLKVGGSLVLLVVIVSLARLWDMLRRDRPRTVAPQFILGAAVFALFAVGVGTARKGPAVRINGVASGSGKPNILLIVMDTVRADHLSLYGYPRDTTPNLREFARGAAVYRHAIAASDFTLGAHATMFTGLYPDWNGAIQSSSTGSIALPLSPQHRTLAEILGSSGYWTVESAANFGFLAPWTGLTGGFAVSDLTRPVALSAHDRPFYLREWVKRILSRRVNTGALDRPSRIASDINRRAMAYLEQAGASAVPFFLFVNYMDAHTPYVPESPFDTRFSGPGGRRLDPSTLHDVKLRVDSGKSQLLPEESQELLAHYDGGIAAEDAAIADLLNRLRTLGLYDNTLIIITADHGDTFGEHDLMDHFLGFVYQELIHVPLIIKYPGQRDATQSDELVSQVDFLPTILEVVGAKPPVLPQGRSLLKPSSRVVFARGTRSPQVGLGNRRFDGLRRAIFSGPMKLITWTSGPPELYDLAADPGERHNLYTSGDPRALDLSRQMEQWVAAMPRQSVQPTRLDKSAAERLRSLGYVQ